MSDIFFELALIFSLLAIASAIRSRSGDSQQQDNTIEIDWGKYLPFVMVGFMIVITWFTWPILQLKIAELQTQNPALSSGPNSLIVDALPFAFIAVAVLLPISIAIQHIQETRSHTNTRKP